MSSSGQIAVALFALVLVSACQVDAPEPNLINFFPGEGDVGAMDAGFDAAAPDTGPFTAPPPENICFTGGVRCRANYTNQIEICQVPEGSTVDVRRWVPSQCSEGNICVNDACAPFICEPERPTCEGTDTTGICNAAGDGLEDTELCPEDTVCRGGLCVDLCEVAQNSRSYIGCEYMVTELPNPLLELEEPFGLVVANPDPVLDVRITVTNAQGEPEPLLDEQTITRPGNDAWTATVSSHIEDVVGGTIPIAQTEARDIVIPPLGVATLLFARQGLPGEASGLYETTRRLSASRPVVAYQFNPYCCNFSFTNDATLLLPIYALGDRYTATVPPDWIAPVQAGDPFVIGGGLTVLAHEDNTRILFTFPEQTQARATRLAPSGTRSLELPDLTESRRWSVTLQANQMLYLESDTTPARRSWLTGTRMEGNTTFAAFSSHACTNIPHGLVACDHLETQLIPDETWGRRFVLPPLARRSLSPREVMYWHFLAGEDGARIELSEPLDLGKTLPPFSIGEPSCLDMLDDARRVITLGPDGDCMVGTRDPVVVAAGKPISVVGYIAGEEASEGPCGGAPYCHSGDPAMFLVPPSEQFRSSYVFLAPETYAFDFATIIIPFSAAGTLTLDGKPLDLSDPSVDALSAPGSSYIIANVPIEDGAHRIEGGTPFGLLIYAYDQYVSYAYAGGLNLTKRP